MTDIAPSAMSPTTLAKPIMWTDTGTLTATSTPAPWMRSRTFCSRAFETAM